VFNNYIYLYIALVMIQLMHCCFLNPLNEQLDIIFFFNDKKPPSQLDKNFICSNIKNLGWKCTNLKTHPHPLALCACLVEVELHN
jgi:hypothetical protein